MLAKQLEVASADVDALADTDWAALTVSDRLSALEQLETLTRKLRAVSHAGMASLALEDPASLGDKPKNVIANRLRISPSQAAHRIRTAGLMRQRTALTGQPLPPILEHTAAHWHAGVLDEEHLRVITGLLTELPADVAFDKRQWAEQFLADHAAVLRPDQLRTLAARVAARINPDGNFTDVDRARRRGLTIGRQHADGMSTISGLLSPELRATLEAMLGKLAAPGKCNPDDESPTVDGEPTAEAVGRDRRSAAQRNHDGLLAAARAVLASGDLGSHHGLPVTIIATTTLDQLENAAGQAVTASGTLLPMRDVIRMASHAYHYLAIFDRHSEIPLYLGRTRRTASAGQRIMLTGLHRGCTFPGCTAPGYMCEVDHIDEWANGGPTDIDTLTFACGPHHKLHTNHGWTLRRRPDGRTEWIPPPQLELPGGGTNDHHHPERLLPPDRE